MLRNIQGWDFIIILVVLLLLFGARKLPDLARSLGASAKEFRKGLDDGTPDDLDGGKAAGEEVSTDKVIAPTRLDHTDPA